VEERVREIGEDVGSQGEESLATSCTRTYPEQAQSTQTNPASGQPLQPIPLNQTSHQNYFSRNHQSAKTLPPPAELNARIEEAKISAKLLLQVVQSTPPTDLLQNDLIREFANRCQSASRSIQGYLVIENPPPDNDTMMTLIETNEQLALSMTKHYRAIVVARKALGIGNPVPPPNQVADLNTRLIATNTPNAPQVQNEVGPAAVSTGSQSLQSAQTQSTERTASGYSTPAAPPPRIPPAAPPSRIAQNQPPLGSAPQPKRDDYPSVSGVAGGSSVASTLNPARQATHTAPYATTLPSHTVSQHPDRGNEAAASSWNRPSTAQNREGHDENDLYD
jgi:hypothetical protein